MAQMSLDTAIRLSAEVKGGGNIDRVKRSLQDLGKNSQLTAREMSSLRSATFQFARANDGTIAGIKSSIGAFRGLQEQAKIGSREFQRYGAEIQKLEAKLRGIDGAAQKAGESLGRKLATGLASSFAAMGVGRAIGASLSVAVDSEESQRRLRSLSTGLDDYSRVQAAASAAAQKFGIAQSQANQEFAQIYARLRPIGLTLKQINTVYNGFNTAAKLSGTSSAEASAAFLQLSQALGTGVLRGEELNSVFEQTPAVVQAIAQVMGVPIGQIRDFAKDGKITGDIVLAALQQIERDGAPKLAEAMKGPAQQFRNLQIAGQQLQIEIGQALLPTTLALTRAAVDLLKGFNQLPDPVKNFTIGVGAAGVAALGLAAAINAIKGALAIVGGIQAVTAALAGKTAATWLAVAATKALSVAIAAAPWLALAAGIAAATYALANYQTQSQKMGAAARTGDQRAMASSRSRLDNIGQETSLLQRQRESATGPERASIDRRLTRLQAERTQLSADLRAGERASLPPAAQLAPRAATPSGSATGTSGSSAAGGSGSRKQAESLGAQIAKSLQQALKLSPAQAAGVVGNLMRESRLNPRVNEGGTVGLPRGVGGYGLAQWTGTRQQDLIRFAGGAAAAGNLQTQLRFIVSELMGPESKALASLRRASSPEEAAVVFERDYERSGVKALGERKANARRVFGEIAGSGAGAGLSDFASILEQQADAAEKLREQEQRIAGIVRERSAEISLMGIKVNMEERIADAQTQGDKLLERRLEGQQRQVEIQSEYARLLADPANQDIRIQEVLITQGLLALKAEEVRTERELQAIERERAEEQRKSTPGFILGEAYNQSVAKLKDLTNAGNILAASADSIGSAFGSAFRDLITGATSASEALGRMFQSIADSFADMAAQMIAEWIRMQILGIVKSIFGSVAGGFSFGGSSGGFNLPGFEMPGYMAGASIPSGFANGAAFDRGIVDSPTLFKFANGGAMRTGVMGEAGPEAILPLKRGINGQLGVQMVGSAQQFAANRAALDGSTTGSGTNSPLAESRQALATAETSIRNRQADRSIEQAFSAPGQALKIQYDSQVINNVEYVTSDQFERGMSQAAERGRALTLGALKNSVKARRQVGI